MAFSAFALHSACASDRTPALSNFLFPTGAQSVSLSCGESRTGTLGGSLFHSPAPLPVGNLNLVQGFNSRTSTRSIRVSSRASGEDKPQLPSDSSLALPPPRNNQRGMGSSDSPPGHSSPPEQPGASTSGHSGASSSAEPVSTDPLWKDVFPEYLRNRESDARGVPAIGTQASTPPLLAGRGGSMEELGPGFRSQSMTSYAMAVPADASMPRYMREPVVRNDPIWAAIRAEARLEVSGRHVPIRFSCKISDALLSLPSLYETDSLPELPVVP